MKRAGKALLAIALIVGAGLFLRQQFERLPIVQHDYPTNPPQAAALQLLQHWQKQTRRITSAAELFPLPDNSVLLILERHQGHLPQWQQQALIDWVESGGTLLINALPLDEHSAVQDSADNATVEDIRRRDPLLYHFGVTAWFDQTLAARAELPLPAENGAAMLEYVFRSVCIDQPDNQRCTHMVCGIERAELEYAWLEAASGPLQLDPEPRIDLLHRDLFEEVDESDPSIPASQTSVLGRANNETHDLVLQLGAGDGQLWIFSNLDIFSNDRLHHLDHAALLEQLSANHQQVWWIESISVPPLGQWLWHRGWPLISALVLLLLVFLWHRMPRRGVMLQSSSLQHQDFTDHLRASSALLWRIGQRHQLLEPLRQHVHRALLKHPGGADAGRRIAVAVALSGLSSDQVKRALEEQPENESTMLELVSLLQHLRRCL